MEDFEKEQKQKIVLSCNLTATELSLLLGEVFAFNSVISAENEANGTNNKGCSFRDGVLTFTSRDGSGNNGIGFIAMKIVTNSRDFVNVKFGKRYEEPCFENDYVLTFGDFDIWHIRAVLACDSNAYEGVPLFKLMNRIDKARQLCFELNCPISDLITEEYLTSGMLVESDEDELPEDYSEVSELRREMAELKEQVKELTMIVKAFIEG